MENASPQRSPGVSASFRIDEIAPAKLNLGLRICARRADGYHEIESLFVPLDLCDRLRVEGLPGARPEVLFSLVPEGERASREAVPGDATNLAARAARLFLEASGWRGAVRIELEKAIPVAAGLGGGSSDAAAVLRVLAGQLPGRLPSGEIERLALLLGADVPYFLDPRPARITGIGERIEPFRGLPRCWVLLANPGIPLSTADVYAGWDAQNGALTPEEAGPTMRALSSLDGGSESFLRFLDEALVNDLEPAAMRLCPAIGPLKRRLQEVGAQAVAMSGSGATVYGVFLDEESAHEALQKVGSEGPVWARVAKIEEQLVSGASPNR